MIVATLTNDSAQYFTAMATADITGIDNELARLEASAAEMGPLVVKARRVMLTRRRRAAEDGIRDLRRTAPRTPEQQAKGAQRRTEAIPARELKTGHRLANENAPDEYVVLAVKGEGRIVRALTVFEKPGDANRAWLADELVITVEYI